MTPDEWNENRQRAAIIAEKRFKHIDIFRLFSFVDKCDFVAVAVVVIPFVNHSIFSVCVFADVSVSSAEQLKTFAESRRPHIEWCRDKVIEIQ